MIRAQLNPSWKIQAISSPEAVFMLLHDRNDPPNASLNNQMTPTSHELDPA